MRARKSGNFAASRALLRALTTQQPNLPQVWLALATVAETRAEQRLALQKVLALDPRNEPAQRGLARMGAIEAAPAAPASAATAQQQDHVSMIAPADNSKTATPTIAQPATMRANDPVTTPAAFTTVESVQEMRAAPGLRSSNTASTPAARDIRWPLYLVIGVSAVVVLLAAIVIRGSEFATALQPAPTAELPVVGAATQPVAPALDATFAPVVAPAITPAAEPESGAATLPALALATPTASLTQPTAAPPTAVPSPQPTPRQTLAPGEVIEQGQWHAILIRPEDAVVLDGSIGSFQPTSRFVLVLLAIGNDGQAPARLPDDLFTLVDAAGKRYTPVPQISTAYLNTYGRGQHGDLSMEDPIPSDGGNKSVPLIFDVPPSAHPLYLLVGDSPIGWSIIP